MFAPLQAVFNLAEQSELASTSHCHLNQTQEKHEAGMAGMAQYRSLKYTSQVWLPGVLSNQRHTSAVTSQNLHLGRSTHVTAKLAVQLDAVSVEGPHVPVALSMPSSS